MLDDVCHWYDRQEHVLKTQENRLLVIKTHLTNHRELQYGINHNGEPSLYVILNKILVR
jgi:hypothetical protein